MTIQIIKNLSKNKSVFKNLFENIENDQIYWKPAPEKWSILEVACHLLDEEGEDFKQRLDFTLNKPGKSWPPIDPQGWVKSRAYKEKNFSHVINEFLNERSKSVDWLSQLQTPAWENSYTHPQAGILTAKHILANWLAHDYLHIRQIIHLNYLYLEEKSAPLKLHYAGNW